MRRSGATPVAASPSAPASNRGFRRGGESAIFLPNFRALRNLGPRTLLEALRAFFFENFEGFFFENLGSARLIFCVKNWSAYYFFL